MKAESFQTPGCLRLFPKRVRDERGEFIKTFVHEEYESMGLPTRFAEEYYSRSVKGVLRGLHFQAPPHQYSKLVSCMHGAIRDVIVDLRVGSPRFRMAEIIELDAEDRSVLFLPPGIAHGFLVLSDSALLAYKTTAAYAATYDTGIRWNSIGVEWGIQWPILSERDASLPTLQEFESPFVYEPVEAYR